MPERTMDLSIYSKVMLGGLFEVSVLLKEWVEGALEPPEELVASTASSPPPALVPQVILE